jgi:uncharacterized protein Smg (DUF494 family)
MYCCSTPRKSRSAGCDYITNVAIPHTRKFDYLRDIYRIKQIYINPKIYHVFMKIIHAEIRNGIIYPKENLDIDDKDVLIRIEDVHEIKLEAREDIIEAIAELDIEEMI